MLIFQRNRRGAVIQGFADRSAFGEKKKKDERIEVKLNECLILGLFHGLH